jgi:hypothetical protein
MLTLPTAGQVGTYDTFLSEILFVALLADIFAEVVGELSLEQFGFLELPIPLKAVRESYQAYEVAQRQIESRQCI